MGYPSEPLSRNPEVGFFDDEDTQHVIAKIASTNRLTIFTGAGIAADLKIPNWSTLVARLLETLEHPRHTDDEDCRSTVGFALDFFHQMPTASIVDALYRERHAHDAIEQRNRDIADILYPCDGHRANQWVPEEALAIYVLRLAVAKRLAGCDVHIVTTNYDDSLERIADSHKDMLSDLGSQGVRVFSNSDATDNGPVEGVPVSHVHGLIPHDGSGRHVVFAEREYIEWDRESKWRDYLIKRFTGGGVTVFVGASLRDYNIAAMIQRFSNGEAYALLPVEDEIAHWSKNDDNLKHDKKWPESTARYATMRGLHLGVRVLRPDFYGQCANSSTRRRSPHT